MRQTLIFGFASVLVLGVSGCQHPIDAGAGSETFGDVVHRNVAAQVIDPDPVHPAGPPEFDGNRAALAIGRYQVDEVKQPRDFQTTTSVGIIMGGGGQ